MIHLNNAEFQLYELDTDKSIVSRIAANMDTLPRYLNFLHDFPSYSSSDQFQAQEIKVVDLLAKIKENASSFMDFFQFISTLNLNQWPDLDLKKDILLIWLANNTELERLFNIDPNILLLEAKPLVEKGYFSDQEELVVFFQRERHNIVQNLKQEISINKKEAERLQEIFLVFSNIDEGLAFTEFISNRVDLQIFLRLPDITLLELFNHIVLNEDVPFASTKKYYKILKDYIPPEEWGKTDEEKLILKVSDKISEADQQKHYVEVQITIEGEVSIENVIVSLRLTTEKNYLSRDQFIDRFLSVFPTLGPIRYSQLSETEIIGIFYFPQERLDTYVFSDLVVNNKLFSLLINIDESSKTTKKKGEGQPWLYIHFYHNTCHVTASITEKIGHRADAEVKNLDPEVFPSGEPYIRVRVKGRDRQSIELFQKILAKLLVIYGQEYNNVVSVYRQFLPDFGIIEEQEMPKYKRRLENIAPEIFLKNYSRNCSQARIPTIVSDKEAKRHRQSGKQVMTFPRPKQKDYPSYASDGENPHYYVCLNPVYPYPGLQINKLSNSDRYPFIPCCFKTNQEKKSETYRRYYYNEEPIGKEKRQQELIVTDKILAANKFGILPEKLEKIFQALDPEENYRYIRTGTHRSQSSFLGAVITALRLDIENEWIDDIFSYRQEMAEEKYAAVARQCAYDLSIKEIISELINPDVYLAPKKYVQLLENFFNCNIYLFNREKMFLPRYAQSYYKHYRDAPCLFIYEHWGSESDHARYPQCELIVRWYQKSEKTKYVFSSSENISMSVNSIFKLLRLSYALNKKIVQTVFPLRKTIVLAQEIDNYGKTRRVDVLFDKKTKITLLTNPMAPLATVEIKNREIIRIDAKKAIEFFQIQQVEQIRQIVNDNLCQELTASIGTVEVVIQVKRGPVFAELDSVSSVVHYPTGGQSQLQFYNKQKKLIRYMTEYIFWLFSHYVKKEKITLITDKHLAKFATKNIKIISNFQYGHIAKSFSFSSGLIDEKKLVVTSEEMLKRLMYVLKLYSLRNLQSLLTFHKKQVITHYYVDLSDFDHYHNQIILHGEYSLSKWLQENSSSYVLWEKIVPGQPLPYFFKNKLVENKVFLAQNTDNLQKALTIAIIWQRKGYNLGMNVHPTKKNYSFILYSYANSEQITLFDVDGEIQTIEPIRLLGYKIEGVIFYTVLLDLS